VFDLLEVPVVYWRGAATGTVRDYLDANWPAVQRVAAALMADGSLSGERAREVAGDLPRMNLSGVVGPIEWCAKRAARRV